MLEQFNETDMEHYAEVLWEIALRNPQLFEQEMQTRSWSMVSWCLYHVERAWHEHCRVELTKTACLSKEEVKDLVVGLFNYVRVAPTAAELVEREKDLDTILGTRDLQEMLAELKRPGLVDLHEAKLCLLLGEGVGIDKATVAASIPANLVFPSLESIKRCQTNLSNPLYVPDALDYWKRQWKKRVVFFSEPFVGGRDQKTDATSETSINQMKNNLLRQGAGGEAGRIRLDAFAKKFEVYATNSLLPSVPKSKFLYF